MIFARRLSSALVDRGMNTATYYLNTSIAGYWSELPKLRRIIKDFQPDIVAAQFGSLTGFTAALLSGRRAVVIFRGSDLNPWSGPWMHVWTSHLLSHLAALNAKHVVCVSKELRNKLWWRRHGVDVLPSGVDHELFQPTDFTSARRELGWDRDEKIVLFNASNRVVKRLDRALASAMVAERLLGRTVRLEILKGDTEPNRIPLLMSAANCLLVVSDYEGSPTVVQEAMACQLPVVSVDVGDVREILANVSPSWVVRRDPEEIGQALAECLRSGESRRSNGRQAMPRCSLHSIAERMEHIFGAMRLPAASKEHGVAEVGTSEAPKEYRLFELKGGQPRAICAPNPEFHFEWWRPSPFRWFPPTLSWRFGVWSLFHHLHLFPCRDFCVAFVKVQGAVIHRTCFVPRYFRWPFSAANDLIVTSTWTAPNMRGRGFASWALSLACKQLQKPERTFWYVTRDYNSTSIAVCRKVGFISVGTAERTTWLGTRIFGQFRVTRP